MALGTKKPTTTNPSGHKRTIRDFPAWTQAAAALERAKRQLEITTEKIRDLEGEGVSIRLPEHREKQGLIRNLLAKAKESEPEPLPPDRSAELRELRAEAEALRKDPLNQQSGIIGQLEQELLQAERTIGRQLYQDDWQQEHRALRRSIVEAVLTLKAAHDAEAYYAERAIAAGALSPTGRKVFNSARCAQLPRVMQHMDVEQFCRDNSDLLSK